MTLLSRALTAMLALGSIAFVGDVRADEKVAMKGVHMCCPGCAAAIEEAVAKAVEDEKNPVEVVAEIDQENGTVALVGSDLAAVQAAVDQIAAAGFHGKLDNKEVKWPKADLPKGKVARLEVTGVHNCCGACVKAIKGALAKVDGVTGESVKPKESSFVIEGDFEPKAAIQALHKAGFHASLPEKK